MEKEKLPNKVLERLQQIKKREPDRSEESLIQEFQQTYNNLAGGSFVSDEERKDYASCLMWAKSVSRLPLESFDIIPFVSTTVTEHGKDILYMYCLIQEDKKTKIIKIKNIPHLHLFKIYKHVLLEKFSSNDLRWSEKNKELSFTIPKTTPKEILKHVRQITFFEDFPPNLREQIFTDFYYTEEWRQLKQQTLERDHYKCRICGSTDHITAHHIVPRIYGGPDTLENLITLCQDCHEKADRKRQIDWSKIWRD